VIRRLLLADLSNVKLFDDSIYGVIIYNLYNFKDVFQKIMKFVKHKQ